MYQGQGTSHPGIGRCFRHGGASPSGVKNALNIAAEQRLHAEAKEASEEDAQPHVVLKSLLRKTAGRLEWIDKELGRNHTPAMEKRFKHERQFLSWIAKLSSEVNLEEIEVQVRASQAQLMATMVREAAARIELNPLQLSALGASLRILAIEAQEARGGKVDNYQREQAEREINKLIAKLKAAEEEHVERLVAARLDDALQTRLRELMPPAELIPDAEVVAEPEPPKRPSRKRVVTPRPAAQSHDGPASYNRTNYKSDLPDDRDPLLKPF